MKKIGSIILFIFLISSFVIAQEAPGLNDKPLIRQIEEGKDLIDEINTEQNKSDYLKQEWRKFLEKNSAGQVLLKVSDSVKTLNPLTKVILGVEYSLSWAFFFAIIIWLTMFFFLVNMVSSLANNRLLGIIITFVLVSLVSASGVTKEAVDILTLAISNIWIATISFVVAIIIVLLFEKFGKIISGKIRKLRKESKETEVEKAQKTIVAHGEVSKQGLKSYE